MNNVKSNRTQNSYDKPIQKPFEELPEWFVRTLHSRMVTKRKSKHGDGDAHRTGSEMHGREAGRQDNA